MHLRPENSRPDLDRGRAVGRGLLRLVGRGLGHDPSLGVPTGGGEVFARMSPWCTPWRSTAAAPASRARCSTRPARCGPSRFRIPTPYPIPPATFLGALHEVASQLPPAQRITVGMPGMLRHGVVVHTPHYITRRGPRSRVLPELVEAWSGYDVRAGVTESLRDAGPGPQRRRGARRRRDRGRGARGHAHPRHRPGLRRVRRQSPRASPGDVAGAGALGPVVRHLHRGAGTAGGSGTCGGHDASAAWSRACVRCSCGTGSTSAAATPSASPRRTWPRWARRRHRAELRRASSEAYGPGASTPAEPRLAAWLWTRSGTRDSVAGPTLHPERRSRMSRPSPRMIAAATATGALVAASLATASGPRPSRRSAFRAWWR